MPPCGEQLILVCPYEISKPVLIVYFRASVPSTTVYMVHIPEYGIFGP